MKYCVYLTIYSGDKMPPFYIGSTSVNKINKGYCGSVSSKQYKIIFKNEYSINRHKFKTIILSYHSTRKEATQKEYEIQYKRKVVSSPLYINKSLAKPNGFFGMDVSGKNNPNYGNKWTDEQKIERGKITKSLWENGAFDNTIFGNVGEKNGRYKDGKMTYMDINGNYIFTSKHDIRVINGELKPIPVSVAKINESKKKNPNLKKYSYIIVLTPNNITVRLEWNEYGDFIKLHKLSNFFQVKKVKGFILIEAKINPLCKLNLR